jgi:hypothetical protein
MRTTLSFVRSLRVARHFIGFFALSALAGCLQKNDAAPCPTSSLETTAGASSAQAGTPSGAGTGAGASLGGAPSGGNLGSGGDGATAATAASGGVTGGTGGAPDSTMCSNLPLAQCQSSPNCAPLSGQRVTGEPPCLALLEVVACGTSVGCTLQPTRATDPDGKDWIFPTLCIPAAWKDSTSTGTRFDACSQPMGAGGSAGSGGTSAGGGSAP